MLNYIWLGLILLAVVIGGMNGSLGTMTDKSLDMARVAVIDIAFPLIGIMALWLGIMRLAERAGLVGSLARVLRPVLRRLFPDVPPDHPAMGSMLMNMAANMLGLGNAATPLGLRAMKDLERLNPRPGTATDAMCTFLAINTSSIQLIPVTAIAVLAAKNSSNPTAIVGTCIIATACAATSGVLTARFLSRWPVFKLAPVPAPAPLDSADAPSPGGAKAVVQEAAALHPLPMWGRFVLAAFGVFFLGLFVRLAFPEVFSAVAPGNGPAKTGFVRVVDAISTLSIPLLLSMFPLYAALRGVKVYEEFVEGAREGFDVALRIIPYLVAILVAVGMFRAAGGITMLSHALGPIMAKLGFPPDLLPLVFMRPLSGSGTLGIFTELVMTFGPDSLIARTAGTIFGSTETTFYVLAVYFGSVGIKKTRYALLAGLTGDLVGVIASVIICRIVFG